MVNIYRFWNFSHYNILNELIVGLLYFTFWMYQLILLTFLIDRSSMGSFIEYFQNVPSKFYFLLHFWIILSNSWSHNRSILFLSLIPRFTHIKSGDGFSFFHILMIDHDWRMWTMDWSWFFILGKSRCLVSSTFREQFNRIGIIIIEHLLEEASLKNISFYLLNNESVIKVQFSILIFLSQIYSSLYLRCSIFEVFYK